MSMRRRSPREGKLDILLVDDDQASVLIIASQLRRLGHRVTTGSDGEEAVRLFSHYTFDVVLMDLVMPRLDGYEATRRIKALAGDRFVPVILLTGVTCEEDLARSLEVGGDDFLIKPVSFAILRAKMDALLRLSDLNRQVAQQNEILMRDQRMAESLFSRVIMPRNDVLQSCGVLRRPASTLGGDLILAARCPDGNQHVLLADLTGHGLYAAIGAMPVAQVFDSMTRKGFAPAAILQEINSKFYRTMPTEMFCAACLARIAADGSSVEVWNGGLPSPLLVRNGRVAHRFLSRHVSLGILEEVDSTAMERVTLGPDDILYFMTDGLTELASPSGEMFGAERVESILASGRPGLTPFEELREAIDRFAGEETQRDDVSLLAIPVREVVREERSGPEVNGSMGLVPDDVLVAGGNVRWSVEFRFHADKLRQVDPVPGIIGQLSELSGNRFDYTDLFTVISELFNNALDHGVLGLESLDKEDPAGFERYLEEREARLRSLEEGWVELIFEGRSADQGGEFLVIHVIDSGPGFDYRRIQASLERGDRPSGRGIGLVARLCRSLSFHDPGNRVEAVYAV